MFCDLVDSTRFARTLDPEDLLELYRTYQETCGSIVGSRGGYVAEYLGDGIVVYFGYPAAREGDERRAVQAALEVVDKVSRIPTPGSDAPLEVRAAVHTGLVVIGTIGSRGNIHRRATGETTLVAFNAQTLAPPSSVVVTDATRRLIEGYFIFERLEKRVTVEKIQKAQVDLFRVLGQTSAKRPIEAAVALGLTPFVGRNDEVSKVRECFTRAARGYPQALLVSGEPGIGKSRLLRVLKEQLGPESTRLVEWDCGEDEQKSALSPVIEWLTRQFGFGADDSDQVRRDKLIGGLAKLLGSEVDSESVRLLASLLSVSLGDEYPPLDLSPDNARRRTLATVVDVVRRSSTAQPCVLAIEDLHWADMSTLELISLLLTQCASKRLLLLMTSRTHRADETVDETIRRWQTEECVTTLELGRLPPLDIATMIREVTRGRELPDQVAVELAERSEGVPLFVEELARTVLESGVLPERRNHYDLTESLEHDHVPSGLQNLLQARLDRLPSLYVAQVLSALGRSCTFAMIRAVVQLPDAELLNQLDGMVKTDLLSVVGEPPDARYSFRHAMIRDAAYRSASQRELLPRLHRDIARVLVEKFPETAEQQPELVAHHLSEAKDPSAAISQWIKAGTQALARSANHESVRHLERGLKELRSLPPGIERDKKELIMRLPLGPALMATAGFSHERIGENYRRANQLASQLPDSP
ncbi:MAG TPA: AAA family ATPase, partial [Polyangiaceae bacterium]|nr:AAA family ATPase [Polyangiaceae bacterium]